MARELERPLKAEIFRSGRPRARRWGIHLAPICTQVERNAGAGGGAAGAILARGVVFGAAAGGRHTKPAMPTCFFISDRDLAISMGAHAGGL